MADPLLTQLGVGGVFAILCIREFRAFAKDRKPNGNGNGKAGERTVEEWEGRMARIQTEAQRPVLDILNKQTELLTEQKDLLKELVLENRLRRGVGA